MSVTLTPEIPADAELMKATLDYAAYRVWWIKHVLGYP